jgi:peroxiredoxin
MHLARIPALALLALAPLLGSGCAASTPAAQTAGDEQPNVIPVTEAMGHPHPGEPAPDFELSDQSGAPTRLSSLRGSVVVLAFVTSWCPFSRAEQPHLKEFADEYARKGVKFLAVDIKETDADYRTYLSRVAMPFPVLRDASGDVALSYVPAHAFPEFTERYKVVVTSNLVLDKDGTIRFFALGDLRNFDAAYTKARKVVDELLAAPGPAPSKA